MVLCVDEKTSLQPRPRQAKTLPAQPGVPVRVEQWFSILQRKRLRIANFADKEVLAERLQAFIAEWNALAHPFNWTRASVTKVMAKCEVPQPNLAIAC